MGAKILVSILVFLVCGAAVALEVPPPALAVGPDVATPAVPIVVPASAVVVPDDDDDRRRGAMMRSGKRSSGWYAGAAFGQATNDDFLAANNDGSLSQISLDDSDTAWRIVGGYDVNRYFGVEGGYMDLGDTSFDASSAGGPSWEAGQVRTDFEADGWFLSAVGRLPVSERVTLFARLGLFSWETTETFTEPSGVFVDENSGSDAMYGAGVEVDVGNPDDVVLYAAYDTTEVDDDGDSVDAVTGGVSFKF